MGVEIFRLLVCGGRNYASGGGGPWARLHARLDSILAHHGGRMLLIHGNAPGADSCADQWANKNGVPCMAFPAPWSKHPRAGGPIRNAWMLEYGRPDLVLAFPGGKGTANMIDAAKSAGVRVIEVDP